MATGAEKGARSVVTASARGLRPWARRAGTIAAVGAALALALLVGRGAVAQCQGGPTRPAGSRPAGTQPAPASTARDAGRDARAIDAALDASTDGASDGSTDARPLAGSPGHRCPPGMLLVEGEYCPTVDQQCLRWLDPDEEFPMRCAEFRPSRCAGRRRHVAVCVDEFEYPNRRGAYPQVMLSWYAARRACEAQSKRLCTMREWTFACEGEAMLPYPYGIHRDTEACHLDHQTRRPDRRRLGNPATTADESARLYEAVPSGQYERCVSPFGIHDMTGNVDEWTRNETGKPYQSGLKGGWWGPIRGRCRPATISHNEGFVYYQIGFRCCADPN